MQNYNVAEKIYLKFLKRTLNVKMSTNTSMIYCETGRYPLTIDIKVSMIKQWIQIIHCSEETNMAGVQQHERKSNDS